MPVSNKGIPMAGKPHSNLKDIIPSISLSKKSLYGVGDKDILIGQSLSKQGLTNGVSPSHPAGF